MQSPFFVIRKLTTLSSSLGKPILTNTRIHLGAHTKKAACVKQAAIDVQCYGRLMFSGARHRRRHRGIHHLHR
jgi:hypothetical protein